MVLATHMVVAGVLTRAAHLSSPLALVLGFASHFLLDSIPHWDYPLGSVGHPTRFDSLKIILDILVGLVLLKIFFSDGLTWPVLCSVAGAILPDALQFVFYRWRPRWLESLQRFHQRVHTPWRIKNHFWGVTSQSLFVGLVLWLSFGL